MRTFIKTTAIFHTEPDDLLGKEGEEDEAIFCFDVDAVIGFNEASDNRTTVELSNGTRQMLDTPIQDFLKLMKGVQNITIKSP